MSRCVLTAEKEEEDAAVHVKLKGWLQGQKQRLDELAKAPASTSPDGTSSATTPVDGTPPSTPTPPDGTPASTPPDSAAPYLLLLSLFVSSPSQWATSCHHLLLGCLRFALSQRQPSGTVAAASGDGGVDSWQEASDQELWSCASPMVRYFGLVQYLQEQLKGSSDADWDARLRSRYSLATPRSRGALHDSSLLLRRHVCVCRMVARK